MREFLETRKKIKGFAHCGINLRRERGRRKENERREEKEGRKEKEREHMEKGTEGKGKENEKGKVR